MRDFLLKLSFPQCVVNDHVTFTHTNIKCNDVFHFLPPQLILKLHLNLIDSHFLYTISKDPTYLNLIQIRL